MAYIPKRFIVVFMLCSLMIILHSMRTNVSVALLETISIVNRYAKNNNNNNKNNNNNNFDNNNKEEDLTTSSPTDSEDFSPYNLWSTREESYVHAGLSCFWLRARDSMRRYATLCYAMLRPSVGVHVTL